MLKREHDAHLSLVATATPSGSFLDHRTPKSKPKVTVPGLPDGAFLRLTVGPHAPRFLTVAQCKSGSRLEREALMALEAARSNAGLYRVTGVTRSYKGLDGSWTSYDLDLVHKQ